MPTILESDITSLQGFSSREIDFYFCQFLFKFLRYSFSNFLLFYSYNIFSIYFPSNSPCLKSYSSATSNFSCLLTSALIFPLKSTTTFLAFLKSFFFPYVIFCHKPFLIHQVLCYFSYIL